MLDGIRKFILKILSPTKENGNNYSQNKNYNKNFSFSAIQNDEVPSIFQKYNHSNQNIQSSIIEKTKISPNLVNNYSEYDTDYRPKRSRVDIESNTALNKFYDSSLVGTSNGFNFESKTNGISLEGQNENTRSILTPNITAGSRQITSKIPQPSPAKDILKKLHAIAQKNDSFHSRTFQKYSNNKDRPNHCSKLFSLPPSYSNKRHPVVKAKVRGEMNKKNNVNIKKCSKYKFDFKPLTLEEYKSTIIGKDSSINSIANLRPSFISIKNNSTWKCYICAFKNEEFDSICAACDCPRPGSQEKKISKPLLFQNPSDITNKTIDDKPITNKELLTTSHEEEKSAQNKLFSFPQPVLKENSVGIETKEVETNKNTTAIPESSFKVPLNPFKINLKQVEETQNSSSLNSNKEPKASLQTEVTKPFVFTTVDKKTEEKSVINEINDKTNDKSKNESKNLNSDNNAPFNFSLMGSKSDSPSKTQEINKPFIFGQPEKPLSIESKDSKNENKKESLKTNDTPTFSFSSLPQNSQQESKDNTQKTETKTFSFAGLEESKLKASNNNSIPSKSEAPTPTSTTFSFSTPDPPQSSSLFKQNENKTNNSGPFSIFNAKNETKESKFSFSSNVNESMTAKPSFFESKKPDTATTSPIFSIQTQTEKEKTTAPIFSFAMNVDNNTNDGKKNLFTGTDQPKPNIFGTASSDQSSIFSNQRNQESSVFGTNASLSTNIFSTPTQEKNETKDNETPNLFATNQRHIRKAFRRGGI
ncbi:MAG: hypothetical protein MHPSP_000005 [Paramarteilia canceri]